jgi:hypothetical protein
MTLPQPVLVSIVLAPRQRASEALLEVRSGGDLEQIQMLARLNETEKIIR